MSMNAVLRRCSPSDTERLRRDAEFVAAMTAFQMPAGMQIEDAMASLPRWMRWGLKLVARQQLKAARAPNNERDMLDLHKSWHGIHWLLCEDPWEGPEPLRYTVFGREAVGEDAGYGPAQLIEPAEVSGIARLLAALDSAELVRRYDARRMDKAEIYPGGWREDSSWKGTLKRDYERLQGFYAEAAEKGEGVIAWMS